MHINYNYYYILTPDVEIYPKVLFKKLVYVINGCEVIYHVLRCLLSHICPSNSLLG